MEGYVIKHSTTSKSQVCFCRLDFGFLRFYTSIDPSARLVGEFRLSGCKVDVKAVKRTDNIPFSFYVEAQRVLVKDRTYALAPKEIVELSGPTGEARTQWGRAIFTWQRHYFKEQVAMRPSDHERERLKLEGVLSAKAVTPDASPTSLGFRIPSLRKSLTSLFEVLTSRANVDESCFSSVRQQPVAIA
ncbi:Aste57867_8204 [Aphanomyces stellatus]|uniref:Aste57867_8204 protein n=1 Tax=Aphanomyces stellatus TaxID=120398 RepID=A0A485KJS5_9STRA|nr:hypothetical protein As57867_008173 [Aphanomyces stellatus]VFT85091.1 Aste57867_8204 [Aphanomyces stellatus]